MADTSLLSIGMRLLKKLNAGKLDHFQDPLLSLAWAFGSYKQNELRGPADVVRYLEDTRTIHHHLDRVAEHITELEIWDDDTAELIANLTLGIELYFRDACRMAAHHEAYNVLMEGTALPRKDPPPFAGEPSSSSSSDAPGAGAGAAGPSPAPASGGSPGICYACEREVPELRTLYDRPVCPECLAEMEQVVAKIGGGA